MARIRASGVAVLALLAACNEAPDDADTTPPVASASAPESSVAANADANADAKGDTNAITCSFPVLRGATAQGLLERFGEDARRETLENEGGPYPVIALWPDDPGKRLEVMFSDESMRKVASLRIAGETPQWTIAGVGLGTKLAQLERRNGSPFEFYGFGWDYGGRVFDWKGGALGQLEGGCSVGAYIGDVMDTGEVLPDELIGDRGVRSDLPSLRAIEIEVIDLEIVYP